MSKLLIEVWRKQIVELVDKGEVVLEHYKEPIKLRMVNPNDFTEKDFEFLRED